MQRVIIIPAIFKVIQSKAAHEADLFPHALSDQLADSLFASLELCIRKIKLCVKRKARQELSSDFSVCPDQLYH